MALSSFPRLSSTPTPAGKPAADKPSTNELYADVLTVRGADQTFDPREIRLSEAGSCGRKQTLRALGYVPTPPNARQLSIFETGHRVEDQVARLWQKRYPRRVKRQITVKSPFGVGHVDIWVAPIHHLVECKTTTEKQIPRLPLASHIDQVTLYLHYWGHAHRATAEIAYVIKETGEIRTYPVTYNRLRARELIVRLMEVQAAITLMQQPLEIPDEYQATQFPCAWYTPPGLERCGFWQYCWGQQMTTEQDKQNVVAVAPPLAPDVEEYAQIRQQRQALDAQAALLKVRQGQLEAGFGQILEERQAQALRAQDITLKRTMVAGRVSTDLAAALDAGVLTPDATAPYQKQGEPWAKWTVRQPKKGKKPADT